MEISENELWILSYYRESELAGALIMGRLARETPDDELRVRLTEHCAEEAEHAWLWTRTILDVGGTPRRIPETYQSRYYAEIGSPTSMLEVLALTRVFEKRVTRHFRAHLRAPDTHPRVAETLQRMLADEVGHLSWVKERLERYAEEGGRELILERLKRFARVDRKVYLDLLEYREHFRDLVDGRRPTVSGRVGGAAEAAATGALSPTSRTKRTGPPADGALEAEVRRLVARSVRVPERQVVPELSLEKLGMDSLDFMVLLTAVEQTFGVELGPADIERIRTVADLTRAILEKGGRGLRWGLDRHPDAAEDLPTA